MRNRKTYLNSLTINGEVLKDDNPPVQDAMQIVVSLLLDSLPTQITGN